MSLKKVSLEVSLKPFCFDMTDNGFAATARKIFRQWENLFSGKQLQLMFWTADGSELLDYSGNMDDAFEYARYVGCAPYQTQRYLDEVVRPLLEERKELLGVEVSINV